nr:nucleotidyltransferase domain-containing protein [uncultured Campylobacter sp.]
MPTKDEILNFLRELKPELESFGIYKVGLFGSYAKDRANIAEKFKISADLFDEAPAKCRMASRQ